jgi:N-acetylglucosamine kinase-like BadF-type ATPase
MSLIIGVDAGGSRTTAVVADGAGPELGRAEQGAGNVRPGTAQAAAEVIAAACRDALQRARRQAPARIMVVGAAGTGREPERLALEEALSRMGLADAVHVTTDAAIALEAAFDDQPGVVLIAGTGSIAWARLPDGTVLRAGGLGPLLGDHGSGFDLGFAALRAVGLSLQGLGPATTLVDRLLGRLGVSGDDLPRWAQVARPAEVAALAPDVLDAASEGDAVARKIAEAGADFLARHARLLCSRFPAGAKVPVALGGGVLAHRTDYRAMTAGRLQLLAPMAVPVKEPVDGAVGAIRLARRM